MHQDFGPIKKLQVFGWNIGRSGLCASGNWRMRGGNSRKYQSWDSNFGPRYQIVGKTSEFVFKIASLDDPL